MRAPLEQVERRLLTTAFMSGVRAVHPEACLRPDDLPSPPQTGRVILLAGGKAAGAMMKVAARHYLRLIDKRRICGVSVGKAGVRFPLFHLPQIEAGHPIPDMNSQKGARQALLRATKAQADDLVVVLLSGGASSLWSAPVKGVTLDDKRDLTRQLLRCGAAITEVNCVRKHLSAIKGGRLALAAWPARVVTLAISDVVGDERAVIGSGPTVGDPTSLEEARAIVRRYDLSVPQAIAQALDNPANETLSENNADFAARSDYKMVANGERALAMVTTKLKIEGYKVCDLGAQIEGEARDVARQHAQLALAQRQKGGKCALLSGGELTVTLRGTDTSCGKGGPSQEYALALAMALDGATGICAFAGDTDGADGGTGHATDPAGAFIFSSTIRRAQAQQLKPATFLDNNDSGTFFKRLDDLLITGQTFTNVNDLRIILINNER